MQQVTSQKSGVLQQPAVPQEPGIIIISAKGKAPAQTYRFPDEWSPAISEKLLALGLQDQRDYLNLYDRDNSDQLSGDKISELWKTKKRECTVRDLEDAGFPDLGHPEARFDRMITRLEKKSAFKYRDEHSEPELPNVPYQIEKLKSDVEARLNGFEVRNPDNHDKEKRQKTVNPIDASAYIHGQLKDGLGTIAMVANGNGKGEGVIYHQPHHDLTPGILWLDEIFIALASEVADRVEQINAATAKTGQLDLNPLEMFVRQLGGDDGGNEFTRLILPGGQPPPWLEEPVDPTRVELFLDGNRIVCASVIVGAWQGGTHSAGHT